MGRHTRTQVAAGATIFAAVVLAVYQPCEGDLLGED